MAALQISGAPDLIGLRRYVEDHLPHYARPLFIRLLQHIPVTETHKPRKVELARDGFDPGSTGDPIFFDDCAAGVANLRIIIDEKLVDRVRDDIGPYLKKRWTELESHPLVGEARSLGLIGAVEIVAKKGTNERFGGKEGPAGLIVRDMCIKHGLMVRAVRDSIVMSPPLIITHAEETDQIGVAVEAACRFGLAPEYMLQAA